MSAGLWNSQTNQHWFPEASRSTAEDEKGAGSDPPSIPIHFAHPACVEEGRAWSTTEGHPKRNQAVTPVSAATPNAVSLLEQISAYPGPWVQLSMWPTL